MHAIILTFAVCLVPLESKATAGPRYVSPQEVFAASEEARANKDPGKEFDCLTMAAQELSVGMLFVATLEPFGAHLSDKPDVAEFAQLKKKLAAMLGQELTAHLLFGNELKDQEVFELVIAVKRIKQAPRLEGVRLRNAIRALAREVKDRRAFWVAYCKRQATEDPHHQPARSRLSAVKISGERATGLSTSASGDSIEVSFRKTSAGWRMEFRDKHWQDAARILNPSKPATNR